MAMMSPHEVGAEHDDRDHRVDHTDRFGARRETARDPREHERRHRSAVRRVVGHEEAQQERVAREEQAREHQVHVGHGGLREDHRGQEVQAPGHDRTGLRHADGAGDRDDRDRTECGEPDLWQVDEQVAPGECADPQEGHLAVQRIGVRE